MNKRSTDPKDRTRVIPLEVSLAYMDSAGNTETVEACIFMFNLNLQN